MVDSSSKYLTFILQATKEVQEKAGEIKTLKSQIHSLTEQVSHLEANKSQVITYKIKELSCSYNARLGGLIIWAGTHKNFCDFLSMQQIFTSSYSVEQAKVSKNSYFLCNSADYLILFLFQLSEEANVWSEK